MPRIGADQQHVGVVGRLRKGPNLHVVGGRGDALGGAVRPLSKNAAIGTGPNHARFARMPGKRPDATFHIQTAKGEIPGFAKVVAAPNAPAHGAGVYLHECVPPRRVSGASFAKEDLLSHTSILRALRATSPSVELSNAVAHRTGYIQIPSTAMLAKPAITNTNLSNRSRSRSGIATSSSPIKALLTKRASRSSNRDISASMTSKIAT